MNDISKMDCNKSTIDEFPNSKEQLEYSKQWYESIK